MPTNPYFNHFDYDREQGLADELNQEVIQMFGLDMVYLPRTLVKEDLIYGEDVLSKFDNHFSIEMYIENVDGFEGEGVFLSKFGIEIRDQATLVVSKTRFLEEVRIAGLTSSLARPAEGDLIYFPLTGGLFEIKFVEDEEPFHQHGADLLYKLKVELFEYSHEKLDTGIPEIDEIEDILTYSIILTLGAGAGDFTAGEMAFQGVNFAGATAKAEIVSWAASTKLLKIKNIIGAFDINANVKGNTGGAEYAIATINDQQHANDSMSDNDDLEAESDAVIDFSETDPFSEGDY